MRSQNGLVDGFEEIKILQQYLYMSEDNYVDIQNSLGVPLRIRMDDDGIYRCKNMNFPDVPETCWAGEMTINTTLNVIAVLKEEPAMLFPKRFNSRWEEIKELTKANVYLNTNRR